MKHLSLFLALFCLLTSSYAQVLPTRFNYAKFGNRKGDTLQYRLLIPDHAQHQRFPLVLFLHGVGERGTDNEAQLLWGVMSFATDQAMTAYPSIVVAPQCPPDQYWANFGENEKTNDLKLLPKPTKPMELLLGLIEQLVQDYPIDTNRIYITGLSMGGFGTFDALERCPNLFAAAVPVCGGGDNSKAASIAHVPIWVFHGADDGTVDPGYSAGMVAALMNAGARPGFTLYPSVGHFSWLAAYSDPLMMAWLFRQHK